ncbi:MAG TPA: caspase family protein, partial [Steroidobacteraceae bacterium]|nr:caspase family protein [Steroidobacteraceae bacterium]
MPAAAGVKRALLIGINDYKSVPGLQGSVNDVQTMREVLVTRWGFPEANIRMVTDQAGTRAGILAALEDLVRTAGPNDTVYF